jgi:hypothetical protein
MRRIGDLAPKKRRTVCGSSAVARHRCSRQNRFHHHTIQKTTPRLRTKRCRTQLLHTVELNCLTDLLGQGPGFHSLPKHEFLPKGRHSDTVVEDAMWVRPVPEDKLEAEKYAINLSQNN